AVVGDNHGQAQRGGLIHNPLQSAEHEPVKPGGGLVRRQADQQADRGEAVPPAGFQVLPADVDGPAALEGRAQVRSNVHGARQPLVRGQREATAINGRGRHVWCPSARGQPRTPVRSSSVKVTSQAYSARRSASWYRCSDKKMGTTPSRSACASVVWSASAARARAAARPSRSSTARSRPSV